MPTRRPPLAAGLTLSILLASYGTVQGRPKFSPEDSYRIIVQRPNIVKPFSGDFAGEGSNTKDAPPVANLNRTFAGQAVPLEVFKVDQTKLTPAEVCAYLRENNPDVNVCEADVRVWIDAPAAIPNDPDLPEQWALNDVRVGSVWAAQQFGSPNIKVCMVDTGSDIKHPDLAPNLWINLGEANGQDASPGNGYINGIDDDNNGIIDDIHGVNFVDGANGGNAQDDNGHGTFVSGVVGAVGNNAIGISGLNQVASVMSCKFMDAQGNGWASDAVRCWDYCVKMGAHIISNSWGGVDNSDALQAGVKQIGDRGIVFVASAGNEGIDTDSNDHFPSTLPDDIIITVAASNRSGGLWPKSNYGKTTVDIAAPGQSVLGLGLGGTFVTMTGTSMATPHVAAAAALLLSQYATNGYDVSVGPGKVGKGTDVKRLLLQTAGNMPGVSGVKLVAGRLDIAGALALVPTGRAAAAQQGFGVAMVEGLVEEPGPTTWRSNNAGQLLPNAGGARPTATLGVIGGTSGTVGNLIHWPITNPYASVGAAAVAVPVTPPVNPSTGLSVIPPGTNITTANGTYVLPGNGTAPAELPSNAAYSGGVPGNGSTSMGPGVQPVVPPGVPGAAGQQPLPGATAVPGGNASAVAQLPPLPMLPAPGIVPGGGPLTPAASSGPPGPATAPPAAQVAGTNGAPLVPASVPSPNAAPTNGGAGGGTPTTATSGAPTLPASMPGPGGVPGAVPGGIPGPVPGGIPGAVPGGVPGTAAGGVPGAVPGGAVGGVDPTMGATAGLPVPVVITDPGTLTGPLSSMFGGQNAGAAWAGGNVSPQKHSVQNFNSSAASSSSTFAVTTSNAAAALRSAVLREPAAQSAPAPMQQPESSFPSDMGGLQTLAPPPPPPPPAAYLNPAPGNTSGPRIRIDRKSPAGTTTTVYPADTAYPSRTAAVTAPAVQDSTEAGDGGVLVVPSSGPLAPVDLDTISSITPVTFLDPIPSVDVAQGPTTSPSPSPSDVDLTANSSVTPVTVMGPIPIVDVAQSPYSSPDPSTSDVEGTVPPLTPVVQVSAPLSMVVPPAEPVSNPASSPLAADVPAPATEEPVENPVAAPVREATLANRAADMEVDTGEGEDAEAPEGTFLLPRLPGLGSSGSSEGHSGPGIGGDEVDDTPHTSNPLLATALLPPFESFPGISFADNPDEDASSESDEAMLQSLARAARLSMQAAARKNSSARLPRPHVVLGEAASPIPPTLAPGSASPTDAAASPAPSTQLPGPGQQGSTLPIVSPPPSRATLPETMELLAPSGATLLETTLPLATTGATLPVPGTSTPPTSAQSPAGTATSMGTPASTAEVMKPAAAAGPLEGEWNAAPTGVALAPGMVGPMQAPGSAPSPPVDGAPAPTGGFPMVDVPVDPHPTAWLPGTLQSVAPASARSP